MLLQIGNFKIRGQGERGVFFERVSQRVNYKDSAGKLCGPSGVCIDSYDEDYRIIIRGCGTLAQAQDIRALLDAQICPEEGQSYFRRRETDDANLEIFKIRRGKLEQTNFRFQYTQARTLVLNATFELEPLPAGEMSDVIENDWTVDEGSPPAVPPAPGTPDPEEPPPVDEEEFTLIYEENFDDDADFGDFESVYPDIPVYPDGWRSTAGYGAATRYYSSRTVKVENGILYKYLHSESMTAPELNINGGSGSAGVYALTAALLPNNALDQLYGKYSVRFRADSLPGYKTAWLLWPQSENWPHDGEIDFPEGGLDGGICAFMHRQDATLGSDQDAFCTGIGYGTWHVADIEWTPTACRFILDGVQLGAPTARIPDTPMHWVLQTEACFPDCPNPATAGYLEIDWIRMYEYTP